MASGWACYRDVKTAQDRARQSGIAGVIDVYLQLLARSRRAVD